MRYITKGELTHKDCLLARQRIAWLNFLVDINQSKRKKMLLASIKQNCFVYNNSLFLFKDLDGNVGIYHIECVGFWKKHK